MRVIDPKFAEAVIERCEDPDDKFLLESLYILGCRIRELLNVTFQDITPTGVRMTVKGGHLRVVPATIAYLNRLKLHGMAKEDKIFNQSYSHMDRVVKRLGDELGHPKLRLHDFRHGYTADLLSKNMSPVFVSQARGDKNLNQVMRYGALTEKALQDQIEKSKGTDNV